MSNLKIINTLPPNYDLLVAVLNPPEQSIFAMNGAIYNPSGKEIDPDIIEHEKVHLRQQKDNPNWLQYYLGNSDFREAWEIEAYARQYQYLRDEVKVTADDLKSFLFEMANALSKDYKLDLSYGEAESKIRNYGSTQK